MNFGNFVIFRQKKFILNPVYYDKFTTQLSPISSATAQLKKELINFLAKQTNTPFENTDNYLIPIRGHFNTNYKVIDKLSKHEWQFRCLTAASFRHMAEYGYIPSKEYLNELIVPDQPYQEKPPRFQHIYLVADISLNEISRPLVYCSTSNYKLGSGQMFPALHIVLPAAPGRELANARLPLTLGSDARAFWPKKNPIDFRCRVTSLTEKRLFELYTYATYLRIYANAYGVDLAQAQHRIRELASEDGHLCLMVQQLVEPILSENEINCGLMDFYSNFTLAVVDPHFNNQFLVLSATLFNHLSPVSSEPFITANDLICNDTGLSVREALLTSTGETKVAKAFVGLNEDFIDDDTNTFD